MPEYEELREPLKQFCDLHGIYGTILLSPEGINIFLSAPREKIDIFVEHIKSDESLVTYGSNILNLRIVHLEK